jgi:hypothetical protein
VTVDDPLVELFAAFTPRSAPAAQNTLMCHFCKWLHKHDPAKWPLDRVNHLVAVCPLLRQLAGQPDKVAQLAAAVVEAAAGLPRDEAFEAFACMDDGPSILAAAVARYDEADCMAGTVEVDTAAATARQRNTVTRRADVTGPLPFATAAFHATPTRPVALQQAADAAAPPSLRTLSATVLQAASSLQLVGEALAATVDPQGSASASVLLAAAAAALPVDAEGHRLLTITPAAQATVSLFATPPAGGGAITAVVATADTGSMISACTAAQAEQLGAVVEQLSAPIKINGFTGAAMFATHGAALRCWVTSASGVRGPSFVQAFIILPSSSTLRRPLVGQDFMTAAGLTTLCMQVNGRLELVGSVSDSLWRLPAAGATRS